jgi:hypothetical protein
MMMRRCCEAGAESATSDRDSQATFQDGIPRVHADYFQRHPYFASISFRSCQKVFF